MKHPHREVEVYQLVRSGELEIDQQGAIWRVATRSGSRLVTPCQRVRAEMGNGSGYLQVRAMIEGTRYYAAAHRLIWFHFKGPIPDGMTVNHKNGVKSENWPDNLELSTYSEQRVHALSVLQVRVNEPKGERHPKCQTTDAAVREMRRLRAGGVMVKEIAEQFRMKYRAVSAICTGRTWGHIE